MVPKADLLCRAQSAMARLGPRASFQTASSLGSEVDSQVQGATEFATDVRVDTFVALGPGASRGPKATAVLILLISCTKAGRVHLFGAGTT